MEKVLNSREEFVLNGYFEIQVQHTQSPAGSCHWEVPKLLREKLERMKSVMGIKNADDLCMARALVVGKTVADEEDNWYERLTQAGGLHTQLIKKLIKDVRLKVRELTFEDLHLKG